MTRVGATQGIWSPTDSSAHHITAHLFGTWEGGREEGGEGDSVALPASTLSNEFSFALPCKERDPLVKMTSLLLNYSFDKLG